MRPHLFAVAVSIMCVVTGMRCSNDGSFRAMPGCPIFLISIDTLRPDHLSCYGYDRMVTPGIDRLAEDGIRFDVAIAHAPNTLPSHASMLTSLYPEHHGAYYGRKTRIPSSLPTLATVLSDLGYRTVSYNGGAQIAPEYGLNTGFDRYVTLGGTPFSVNNDSTFTWIEENGADSTFFFLHTYEVHYPFTPRYRYLKRLGNTYKGPLPRRIDKPLLMEINQEKRQVSQSDIRHIIDTYDAEILSMDEAVAAFIDSLKALGLYDNAVIVFTSDHGEEFGEHGMYGWHGHTMYDELLHVPLIIKLPKSIAAGTVINEQVRSIDIAPTILEIAGSPIPVSFAGKSLIPMIFQKKSLREPPFRNVSKAQKDMGRHGYIISIRTSDWKLFCRKEKDAFIKTELFHLPLDPEEQSNRVFDYPVVVDSLKEIMFSISDLRPVPAAHPANPSAETKRRLEALGYVVTE